MRTFNSTRVRSKDTKAARVGRAQTGKTQTARPSAPPRGVHDFWIYLALFVATMAVYGPVRRFDFVNYDDPEYVTANPHVREGVTAESLRWAFTSGDAANWFPLTRLVHIVDYQLFDNDSGMHHEVNVLLHALAALALFAFLKRATGAQWPSAFVAFVFALHPLHVESIAWVSECKDVLSGFFWFVALWAYVRYTERPGVERYLVIVVAFCLGVLAKPMVVTLPFVLLLLDVWPLRRMWALVREKLPLLLLSAAVAVVTYEVQQSSRAVKTLSVFPLTLRIENALVSYAIYIGKTVWPSDLAVFYPYPHDIALWKAIAAALALMGVTVWVVHEWRRRPYLGVGWFWYMGTLVPVIGLVQVGAQARADRYTYLPMAGLLIMLAWGARDAVKRWPSAKPVIASLAAASVIGCAAATSIQMEYWRNSEALFAHALAVTHGNYVAHHNYGLAIADEPGRLPEAINHYRAALAIRRDSVEAHSDLGNALSQTGALREAAAQYQAALQIAPDSAIPHNNLGNTFFRMGRLEEAIAEYETAVRLRPDYAEAHNNLGAALASVGRTQEAIEQFQAALRIQPDYEQAQKNLRLALGQTKY